MASPLSLAVFRADIGFNVCQVGKSIFESAACRKRESCKGLILRVFNIAHPSLCCLSFNEPKDTGGTFVECTYLLTAVISSVYEH